MSRINNLLQKSGITDGTSNTLLFGERSTVAGQKLPAHINKYLTHQTRPQGTTAITDGTSNTVVFGETTGQGGITDGTSNTMMFGERLPTTGITDGTSNTIMLGETIPGMSYTGACEALRGEIVGSYEDRKNLAGTLIATLCDGSVRTLFGDGSVRFLKDGTSSVFGDGSVRTLKGDGLSLLLPAVQKIREAAARIHPSFTPTFAGTLQLLSGQPVSNPHDRKIFAYLLSFLLC